MSEGTIRNEGGGTDAPEDEQERIRRQRIAELKALCDRIGAEAEARGMTEDILKDILRD